MHEAAAQLRARKIASVELVRACVARIEALDRDLVAFITRTVDEALAEAERADRAFAAGQDRGPLQGIPVALKDLYDQREVVTTGGSKIFAKNLARADSAVTARLRAAGAVFVGKTNLHEWAYGVTNQNPHFGPAKNPWDRSRIPGGSSGGSAIAVATGMCTLSPGSDTGGSIRIPAALCGIAGLKPTYGRVSLRGVVPLGWSLDHAGPLAHDVRDLAVTLQALAGYDAEDPSSVDVAVEDYTAHLQDGAKGLRILVPTNHFFETCDAEVEGAVRGAVALLARAGARVEERPLPNTELLTAQRAIISVEAAAFHRERLRDAPQDFGDDVRARLASGTDITALDHAQARRHREILRRAWTRVLDDFDVIATPTTRLAAPPREGQDAVAAAQRLTANTSPFNLTGLPAVSIPCGFTRDGLPIGLQLAAGPWREAVLLRAARAYERETEWHERHPKES